MLKIIEIELKDKIRKKSFLWILFISIFIPFFVFPNEKFFLNSLLIEVENYKQFSHSSWVSMAVAYCSTLILPLFCIIYTKNSIILDKNKFPIIFISKLDNISYFIAKYISNIILSLIVLLFLILGSLLVTIINFPIFEINFYSFISPFIVLIPNCLITIAITNFIDVIFNNKKITMVSNYALIIIYFLIVLPINNIGGFVSGSDLIRNSILMSQFEQYGIYLNEIRVLGNVSFEKIIGEKTLVLYGILDVKNAIFHFFSLTIVSVIITGISSYIFLIRNKYFEFAVSTKTKVKVDNKASILPKLIITNNSFLNSILIRFYLLIKENKMFLLLYFVINIICSIFIKVELVKLVFLPMSFVLLNQLISSIGAKDYKNDFINTFKSLPNNKLLLPCNIISAFIIVILVSLPSLITMFVLNQDIYSIILITLILNFILLSCLSGEVTKQTKLFEIIFLLIIYTLTSLFTSPINLINFQTIIILFVTNLILFALCSILRYKR